MWYTTIASMPRCVDISCKDTADLDSFALLFSVVEKTKNDSMTATLNTGP
jgi:hypothetical protein